MRTPENVAFGYDVGKISACCLVLHVFVVLYTVYILRKGIRTVADPGFL